MIVIGMMVSHASLKKRLRPWCMFMLPIANTLNVTSLGVSNAVVGLVGKYGSAKRLRKSLALRMQSDLGRERGCDIVE